MNCNFRMVVGNLKMRYCFDFLVTVLLADSINIVFTLMFFCNKPIYD